MKQTLAILSPLRSRAAVLGLLSLSLLTVYVYVGDHTVFEGLFRDSLGQHPWFSAMCHGYQFVSAQVLLLVIPVLVLKFGYRAQLSKHGFALGDWRFGFKFMLVAMVVLAPVLWMNSLQPEMRAEYPLSKVASQSPTSFVVWELFYLVYYIAWEFHFRGFLQFGLNKDVGTVGAVLVQTFASTLLHIGKPWGETSSAIVAGVIFGAVALRTRSFLYVLLLHWYVGIMTDLFCTINATP